MVLEKQLDLPSAKVIDGEWVVKNKTMYRWLHPDKTPASDWMYDFDEVLRWIKEYDIHKV